MIEILLLHIFVIILSMLFAYIGVIYNKRHHSKGYKWNYGYLLSFLLLLIFLGFRLSLGRDWNNYERIYTDINQQDFVFGESRELGFLLIVRFLNFFGLEFQSFILVTSFLTLCLFFNAYKKIYYLLPFGIFIFFMDWGYPVVINTIRQGIALFAFMNAVRYIDNPEKNSGRYFLLYILGGSLFHYSILLFLPTYYIGKIKQDQLLFSLTCLVVFIMSLFVITPLYRETMSVVTKYESYETATHILNDKSSFGLGATLVLLIRFAPIILYQKVKKENPILLKYFVLYYIGLSIYYGFYEFLLITRFTFYFQFLEIFVLSYFIYYMTSYKKRYILFGVLYVGFIVFNYIYTFIDFVIDQVAGPDCSVMFMEFRLLDI